MLDKSPPHDEDAERSLLGSMLLDSGCSEIVAMTKPEYFYFPDHQRVFAAIQALFLASTPIDVVLVHDQLRTSGQSVRPEFLVSLMQSVPSSAHAEHYHGVVVEAAVKRQAIAHSSEIIQHSYNGMQASAIVEDAAERFSGLSESVTTRAPVDMRAGLADMVDHVSAMQRGLDDGSLAAPWHDLAEKVRFYPQDLIVVAARPSMGKTSFALNLARLWAEKGHPGLFFSIETPSRLLFTNLVGAESRLSPNAIRSGTLAEMQLQQLYGSVARVMDYPIHVIDSSSLTLSDVRSQCMQMKRAGALKWVIVDYLQLMDGPESERRDLEVAAISKGLKKIARDLETPVIALAQLSRLSERRGKDKRPMLSDLKESGGIEQDADVVLLLHREAYYTPDKEDDGTTHVIIAKQRNGPTGDVQLMFLKSFLRFELKEKAIAR
tara:strand:+ start:2153 stop:3457 length:1305 start_codon:yes stop_codon:yes gene_type:complete